MKKLLLTGFEPFLDYPINPTREVVKSLSGKVINDFEVHGEILTVDFAKSGEQLLATVEKIKPDAIISLGLAGGRHKMTPERIAINCNDGPADNTGWKPNGEKIFADGKDGIFTTLPIDQMVKYLTEAGLPAEISNTAGTYLCNNVMYHALYYIRKNQLSLPAGFIHIPASHELAIEQKKGPSWSQEDLNRAVALCIACL
ncbi:pyroglutamyl-peptidase I [Virgibacillus oceani]